MPVRLPTAILAGFTLAVGITITTVMTPLSETKQMSVPFRYVITEPDTPSSFDPLDADRTRNLHVARMIYSAPLEMSDHDELSSRVLEHFEFDESENMIRFKLKSGLRFSDGKSITPRDLELAILRMALARPQFPVIRQIRGLQEWLSLDHPLQHGLEGIKVRNQDLEIFFDGWVRHPLFRFTLELFSIIPADCIDLRTSRITCEQPPSSGPYLLAERSARMWRFKRRIDSTHASLTAGLPEEIEFIYPEARDAESLIDLIDDRTVISGNELTFSRSELELIAASSELRFLPATRFASFLLSQKVDIFRKAECRRVFAKTMRKSFQGLLPGMASLEIGPFTKLLPGYISPEMEEAEWGLDTEIENYCRKALRGGKLPWGVIGKRKHSIFEKALAKTADSLGMKLPEPTVFSTGESVYEAFVRGAIGITTGSSGFWPHDPVGDVQMYFTPGLHPELGDLTGDPELQKRIDATRSPGSNISSTLEEVNRYLLRDAKMNTVFHTRRFYFSTNGRHFSRIPFSLSTPAPWQVFHSSM